MSTTAWPPEKAERPEGERGVFAAAPCSSLPDVDLVIDEKAISSGAFSFRPFPSGSARHLVGNFQTFLSMSLLYKMSSRRGRSAKSLISSHFQLFSINQV